MWDRREIERCEMRNRWGVLIVVADAVDICMLKECE